MKPRTYWRLFIVSAAVFLAWVGWLGYLAVGQGQLGLVGKQAPPVLQRGQVLVSDVDVLAQVDALNQPVTVKKVLRAPFKKGPAEGEKLTLANLNQCDKKDWSGPGEYVIPLSAYPAAGGGTDFLVTRVEARLLGLHDLPNNPQFVPHVYRATPETLAQLKQLTGPDETP
jgi:hypothetical protein